MKSSYFLMFLLSSVVASGTNHIWSRHSKIIDNPGVIIATNREYLQGEHQKAFFSDNIAENNKLSYVSSYTSGEKTAMSPLDGIKESFDLLENGKDIVIFVHGDGKDMPLSIERANSIARTYDVNVIAFSWPSLNPEINGAKNFKNSQRNVANSLPAFYAFLKDIQKMKAEGHPVFRKIRMNLFLHSLGNHYLELLVKEGMHKDFNSILFDNLTINSAAVSTRGHADWVSQLSFQERIYITSNRKDFALKGAGIITFRKQLGSEPSSKKVAHAHYIDFTDAVGLKIRNGIGHTFFLNDMVEKNHNIRHFYQNLIRGESILPEAENTLKKARNGNFFEMIDLPLVPQLAGN